MYTIKLNSSSTNKTGVYIKHALIVVRDHDEYIALITAMDTLNGRLRRKRIYYINDITQFIPNDGATWVIYVTYRYTNTNPDWTDDIKELCFGESKQR